MSLAMEISGDSPLDSPLARFSWLRAAVAFADEAGPVIRDALKDKAPVGKDPLRKGLRVGRMRDSIRYERSTALGGVTCMFYAPVPYTPYVLDGTKPHTITASAARALQFAGSDGQAVYRRSVSHPGTRANPFPERAVEPLGPWLVDAFREAVRASMEGA